MDIWSEDGGGRCGMDEERCDLWRSEEVSFVRIASDEGQEAEDDGREWGPRWEK
jgi:hypothetical protein